jgi:mRNA interferase RelE/StbE
LDKKIKIYQSSSFSRKVKRLKPAEKADLDQVIRDIINNPEIGVEKKGDLKGIFIYKFKLNKKSYLLAYRIYSENNFELIMIGPHENYYRDLKRYLES